MRNEDAIELMKQRAASGAPDHSRGVEDPNARLTDLRKAFQRYYSERGIAMDKHDSLESEQKAMNADSGSAGAVMDADEDFSALHALVTGAKGFDKDADVAQLRTLVKDCNAKKFHAALDKVLERVRERRVTGDRKFLRRVGVKP